MPEKIYRNRSPDGERLHKVLARTGRCSRRLAEEWIAAGRLRVNGRVAVLGLRVAPQDEVRLDGKRLRLHSAAAPRVLLYHKDCGEICTRSDPQRRPTVFDNLPAVNGRWLAVGRLDFNTSGLLLFTDDGALAQVLMHPSSNIEREYVVRVRGQVNDAILERLRSGVFLEDGSARFSDIRPGGEGCSNRWFHVVLTAGRNREVRRLWESQGLQVSRLKRVRFGSLFLPASLRRGCWQELTSAEAAALRANAASESVA